jgi:hypothetical protein
LPVITSMPNIGSASSEESLLSICLLVIIMDVVGLKDLLFQSGWQATLLLA